MNFLEIREYFRDMSGRFDLVDSNGVDLGAGFYINEARKFLDMLDETNKSNASAYKFVTSGNYIVSVQHSRAIKEVWAATSTARWPLEKKDLGDLLYDYLSDDPTERTNGAPEYYSPTLTRYIPEDVDVADLEAFSQWVEVPSGDAHEYNTILLNVPVEETTMIEVKGLFYSAELVDNSDFNYWSKVHPMLLIMATMRQVEIINRNTQGVNDWTGSIMTAMKQLGMDFVEEQIAGITQIGD